MKLRSSHNYPRKTLKHFDLLPSTNDFAHNLIQIGDFLPEGSIIHTNNQTKGKGQGKNQWVSSPNQNLTFSMIYYPKPLPLRYLFALNMISSLAVLEAAKHQNIKNLSVKWPNDILYNDQKIAGILIRNTLSQKSLTASIIGIGLNVNQTIFDKNLPRATSLALATNQQLDRQLIFQHIIDAFERRYTQLLAGDYINIKTEYLKNLYRFGLTAKYYPTQGEPFQGKIIDVLESGHLVITSNGQAYQFATGEISFWKK